MKIKHGSCNAAYIYIYKVIQNKVLKALGIADKRKNFSNYLSKDNARSLIYS